VNQQQEQTLVHERRDMGRRHQDSRGLRPRVCRVGEKVSARFPHSRVNPDGRKEERCQPKCGRSDGARGL
jgi:hypothetical protein